MLKDIYEALKKLFRDLFRSGKTRKSKTREALDRRLNG